LVQKSGIREARRLLAQANPDLVAVGRLARAARNSTEFKAFCSAVGLGTRKAYDLIAIADAVEAGRLQEVVVQEIGWAKARLIAEHAATKSKARQALAFARKNTLAALVAYFQGSGAGVKLITKSFHLTVQQAQYLDSTLVQAGAQRRGGRLDNRADVLMRILRAYRQSIKPHLVRKGG
jgi:predicted Zn-dependent protease